MRRAKQGYLLEAFGNGQGRWAYDIEVSPYEPVIKFSGYVFNSQEEAFSEGMKFLNKFLKGW